jgi:hypothetical protein
MRLIEEVIGFKVRSKYRNIENGLTVSGSGKSLSSYFRECRHPVPPLRKV